MDVAAFEVDVHSSNYISLHWKRMTGSPRLSCQGCLSLYSWDKSMSEVGKIASIQNLIKVVPSAIQWLYWVWFNFFFTQFLSTSELYGNVGMHFLCFLYGIEELPSGGLIVLNVLWESSQDVHAKFLLAK